MRIMSPLVLLLFGAVAFLIGFLMHSGLPTGHSVNGPNIFYVPIIIAALQVLLAIVSIFLSRRPNPPPFKDPAFIRWVLFFAGSLILFIGFVLFSVSLYSPYLFGSDYPVPEIGVISWLVVSLIASLILFVVSKMNSTQRPNLMRYFALAIAGIAALLTTAQALIFIFAMPIEPPSTFPFFCGLMTTAFIPIALMILGISKDYVSIQR